MKISMGSLEAACRACHNHPTIPHFSLQLIHFMTTIILSAAYPRHNYHIASEVGGIVPAWLEEQRQEYSHSLFADLCFHRSVSSC